MLAIERTSEHGSSKRGEETERGVGVCVCGGVVRTVKVAAQPCGISRPVAPTPHFHPARDWSARPHSGVSDVTSPHLTYFRAAPGVTSPPSSVLISPAILIPFLSLCILPSLLPPIPSFFSRPPLQSRFASRGADIAATRDEMLNEQRGARREHAQPLAVANNLISAD